MKCLSKIMLSLVICLYCLFRIGFVASATTNPISIMTENMQEDTVTIGVYADKGADLQAFKLVVAYPIQYIFVDGDKGVGYGYDKNFMSKYNATSSAITAYNNLVTQKESKVILAGAQADTNCAVMGEKIRIGYINFRRTEELEAGQFTRILSKIVLQVQQLSGSSGDLVKKNPDDFHDQQVQIKENQTNESQGEQNTNTGNDSQQEGASGNHLTNDPIGNGSEIQSQINESGNGTSQSNTSQNNASSSNSNALQKGMVDSTRKANEAVSGAGVVSDNTATAQEKKQQAEKSDNSEVSKQEESDNQESQDSDSKNDGSNGSSKKGIHHAEENQNEYILAMAIYYLVPVIIIAVIVLIVWKRKRNQSKKR